MSDSDASLARGTAGFDHAEWSRFCRERVAPAARACDQRGTLDAELWREICARGFLALFHRRFDDSLAESMLELAGACASSFWRACISSALCGRMLAELGGEALAARWLPGLITGERIGCFAATERGSGSDPQSYAARVQCTPRGWSLRGEKPRVANGANADVAAVLCPALDEQGGDLGLSLSIVDLRAPGVVRKPVATLGLRGMGFAALEFDAVELESAAVVLDTTMAKTLRVVEWGQLIQAVCGLGVGYSAVAEAEEFLRARMSFGRPLLEHPVVEQTLREARLELDAGKLLARAAIGHKGRGELAGEVGVMAKIFASEAGLRACQAAVRVCGSAGYTSELEIERKLRDAFGNIPAGLPNDRLRELLIASRLDHDPWSREA